MGVKTATPTVTTSYWDTDLSGQSSSAGGTGKTTSELQAPTAAVTGNIYENWDTDQWDFVDAKHFPFLKAAWDATSGATWQEFGEQDPEPEFTAGSAIADQTLVQGTDHTIKTALHEAKPGNGPTTYSVASLPTGITLNADRELTGTPTLPLAMTQMTYTAAYTDDGVATLTFNLSVQPKATTLSATASGASITLNWTAVTGVDRWQYQQDDSVATCAWTAITGSDASTNSHTVTGLTNGRSYTFGVRAFVGTGEARIYGLESNAVEQTPPIGAPTDLSATIVDGWTANLSWTAPAGELNGYEYRHRLCPCTGADRWSEAKPLNGYGAWLYLDEPYTPPVSKEVLGLPAGVHQDGNTITSEVQLRAVSGIHMQKQRGDHHKWTWSDSVTVSLMGGWHHRTTGTWATTATPGRDKVTFGWTVPVSLEDLKRFNASVQIAWWETAGSVPADKSWVNVSTYGAPTVSGATSVEWWSPATEFNYQIAFLHFACALIALRAAELFRIGS